MIMEEDAVAAAVPEFFSGNLVVQKFVDLPADRELSNTWWTRNENKCRSVPQVLSDRGRPHLLCDVVDHGCECVDV